MSSTRQAVIFGPNLIGCGNRLDLTPAHQVLLLTGIGPQGAMIFFSRTNPASGRQSFAADFDAAMGALASNPFMVFSWHLRSPSKFVLRENGGNCPP
jgi:hypothetical protein